MFKQVSTLTSAVMIAALLGFSHGALAQEHFIRHVDIANGSLSGDGTAWGEDAYKYLQDALAWAAAWVDANEADTVDIWVAAGTYRPDQDNDNPNGTDDSDARFEMLNNVRILGGFEGNETDPEERDPAANETILSGQLTSTHSRVVVYAEDVGATAVLDGFTITDGRGQVGAGIWVHNAEPRVVQCLITNNQAQGTALPHWGLSGAGIACTAESGTWEPRFTDCVVKSNSGTKIGGGIYVAICNFCDANIHAVFIGCSIIENSADVQAQLGGGMFVDRSGASATVVNSTFTSNEGLQGAAIAIASGHVRLHNSVVVDHEGQDAIWVRSGGTVEVVNSTIAANSSGAALGLNFSSTAAIDNTIMWSNTPNQIAIHDSGSEINVSWSN